MKVTGYIQIHYTIPGGFFNRFSFFEGGFYAMPAENFQSFPVSWTACRAHMLLQEKG